MSDPGTTEFLVQILNRIKNHCSSYQTSSSNATEHYNSILHEMIGVSKELAESYPSELAQAQLVKLLPSIITRGIESMDAGERDRHLMLKNILIVLFVGSQRLSEKEYNETKVASQILGSYNFLTLSKATQNLQELVDAHELRLNIE